MSFPEDIAGLTYGITEAAEKMLQDQYRILRETVLGRKFTLQFSIHFPPSYRKASQEPYLCIELLFRGQLQEYRWPLICVLSEITKDRILLMFRQLLGKLQC